MPMSTIPVYQSRNGCHTEGKERQCSDEIPGSELDRSESQYRISVLLQFRFVIVRISWIVLEVCSW